MDDNLFYDFDVKKKNAYHRSILHKAAYYSGSVCVIQDLLSRGADVNARDKGSWTPLHLASKNGHIDAIQCLLANGADLNIKDFKHGWTPLHVAIVSKQYKAASILIASGSCLDENDLRGYSAGRLFELASQEN